MSEENVIAKLTRFTPGAVDRDAMLFAAGRASVRPVRFWKWATAVLVATQLLTFGWFFLPKAEPIPSVIPEVKPIVIPETAPPTLDPYSLLALSRNPDVESKSVSIVTGPSRPPLMAFTRNFQP